MRKILVLIFAFCTSGFLSAATYTLSFVSDENVYLIQFDDSGHVTKGPVEVASNTDGCSSKTALVDAGGELWLYYSDTNAKLFLARVNKSTLSVISRLKFSVTLETNKGGFLSATEAPWFLAAGVESETLKALPLNPATGKLQGKTFRLSPRTERSLFNAGVAADGGAAWAIAADSDNHTTIFVQGLGPNGKPDGRIDAYATLDEIQSADLTNVLPGNQRFLVYRKFNGDFDPSNTTSPIFLQAIDATTLQKVGPRRTIDNFPYNCFTGSMAAEANGHFLVYPRQDFSCSSDLVVLQFLDALGNASGPQIPLTNCSDELSAGGFDLIEN